MQIAQLTQEQSQSLNEICIRHKVLKLFVFGSQASGNADVHSDVDLIVELLPMSPLEKGENLLALWEALEDLFQCRVDLLTDRKITNPYLRSSINKTKRLLYDRAGQEVSR